MSEQDHVLLLTEIRDLARQQLELTKQSLQNQARALENQQQAVSRQITNQEVLIKARKWTRILLGSLLIVALLYLLQPAIVFLWFWTQRH
jgi:hypothetical protein